MYMHYVKSRPQLCDISILVPCVELRKLRKVRWLAQSPAASKWQGQNLKLGPAHSLCQSTQSCHFLGWHFSDLK